MTTPAGFVMKANDLKPVVRNVLDFEQPDPTDSAAMNRYTAALADLQTALAHADTDVTFILKLAGANGAPVTGAPKVNKAAVVVDAATRTVEYRWELGDTNAPGSYLYEWEVIGPDNKPQTFPGDSYNVLTITADLDAAGV